MNNTRPIIAVIGTGRSNPVACAVARTMGELIALGGYTLVTGGLGGVMEAASAGAADKLPFNEHARIVGILPGEDPATANPYVGTPISTGLGFARNAIIARAASGLIAIGGGSGTLSEVALAWQFGKPIVILRGLSDLLDPLIGDCLDDKHELPIMGANTPEQALELLEGVW